MIWCKKKGTLKTKPKKRKKRLTAINPGCKLCNKLRPQGHTSISYNADSATTPKASLTLGINPHLLSASKCDYCKLLKQSLREFVGPEWSQISAPVCLDLVDGSPIILSVQESNGKTTACELYTPSDERPPWPALGHASRIPISSASEASFEFARNCIKDCLSNTNHTACRNPAPTIRPTRLIDVRGDDRHIKLVELNGKIARYITLSYCWGAGSAVTTTISNVQRMRQTIEWDTLPALFQDAINITRRLNVPYLWIDGLCIVQDDHEDWERESSKMSDIYEASYVTIAADWCEDNSHRCLTDRPKRLHLQHQTTPGKSYTVKVRKRSHHHEAPEEGLPFQVEGPLRSRAWALQETMLSPRILHYTETEIAFECRSTFRCECTPSPRRKATTPGLLPKLLSCPERPSKIFRAWQRVLAQFTLRKLTVPSDKLPAISGIAKKVQIATESAYLAGLWNDNLVEDLLWASAPHLESPHLARRLVEYRAPSFSWASVDTQIQPFVDREDPNVRLSPYITITQTSCTVFGANPLGAVTGGFIDVCGPVVEATLVAPERYKFEYYLVTRSGATTVGVAPDSLLVQDPIEDDAGLLRGMVRRGREGESYKPFKAPVWCLSVGGHSQGCISGLVLTGSARVPGDFERIGYFSCGNDWLVGAKTRKIRLV
ncbi:hypothetical protein AYL99_06397 [Fonsecaea erecta]|uniref:Heterokaryon incompatibility domain-containing protein n=1 Tax=Fonsecaea erecta TaxID=1367422 RepID=A0A178ZH23_9EURO|nr:hypothetical protein AYL99_06397 [Fonsecaea erecta]OAP59099.1 hypothetical protein AYL99_06397 [Fonsecaea erecta]